MKYKKRSANEFPLFSPRREWPFGFVVLPITAVVFYNGDRCLLLSLCQKMEGNSKIAARLAESDCVKILVKKT